MKRLFLLFLISVFLICSASAQTDIISSKTQIIDYSKKLDESSSYADLWHCYNSIEQYANYQKDTTLTQIRRDLMEMMLFGRWEGTGDEVIKLEGYYDDYNNTNLRTTLTVDLPTSKKSGQSYYYYTESTDEGLIIGYKNKITEDKTDNFLINFKENEIIVFSYITNATYNMIRSSTYNRPIRKDNAKNAYIYIANIIDDFYDPRSVVINQCQYNASLESCYFSVSAANRVGGTVRNSYYIIKFDGSYSMNEWPYDITSNVNIKELNQKLQEYVNRMYN